MHGISYYDLRHVTGEVTHIDIDNGVVESAGTSFFNKAILRVLAGTAGESSRSITIVPVLAGNSMKSSGERKGLRKSPKRMLCSGRRRGASSPCLT